ncbi:tRNA1(Val) (adenine(37)-N6)-methyltransferase [Mangrovimonas aestuarii]|uniref:tRNA1(Val) (adenine(37)-N6)-methyltransferase n=1 Tax=Mangrovimonas aestuarii TaxID=3018443 RepID=UPI0023792E3A|nr:methyltransferase [Mangrovimonas aestuarii]
MNKPFQFKQFTIHQDRCAMKVGTDGTLLGAWAPLEHNPFSILDIGAGTGLIALMLAQRSNAELVDALEIDDAAYEQCVDNFEASPWGDRLFCYHASLLEFTEEIEDQYDLIVSNPPFYSEDYKSDDSQRDLARFADAMPFEHLIECAAALLAPEGLFTIIIPYKEYGSFTSIAKENGLYANKALLVKGSPESEIKRALITFSRNESTVETTELTIETTRHQYTEDYINLTKEFYLKM